jgi:hypothetical protein
MCAARGGAGKLVLLAVKLGSLAGVLRWGHRGMSIAA